MLYFSFKKAAFVSAFISMKSTSIAYITLSMALTLALPAHASAVEPSCIGAEVHKLLHADSAAATFGRILDGTSVFQYELRHASQKDSATLTAHEVGKLAAELSDSERSRLLSQLATAPRLGIFERRFLELALQRPEAWTSFVQKISTNDARSVTFNYLKPVIATFSPSLRQSLLKQIGTLYPAARKPINTKWHEYSPKRGLELLMRLLNPPENFFTASVQTPRQTLKAYGAYLASVHQVIGHESFGDYSAKDVLKLAKEIQRVLKRSVKEQKIAHPVAIIEGSFPNGRAVMYKSDLDLHLSSPGLYPLEWLFNAAVTKALERKHPGLPLKSSLLSISPDPADEAQLAQVSPITIRVTPDAIELLLYPAREPLPTYEFHEQRNLVEPMIYSLSPP
jgi:hypothetical protein